MTTTHYLYNTWAEMRKRCNDPRNSAYKNYGGRGIKVCKQWSLFSNFLADMGDRPEGFTLDRIDNNKGYSPGNCRWASRKTQAQNRRDNVWVLVDDVKMVMVDADKFIQKRLEKMGVKRYGSKPKY